MSFRVQGLAPGEYSGTSLSIYVHDSVTKNPFEGKTNARVLQTHGYVQAWVPYQA